MLHLHKAISQVFCCFGCCHHEDGRQPRASSNDIGTKDTPVSTSVHGATVPHALDSPDALHKIFASNSSARGYSAVRIHQPEQLTPQAHADSGFNHGPNPPKRPHGKLEHLAKHIKTKLSETRLTPPIPSAGSQDHFEAAAASQPLGQSQKSIGLIELLASRTVSEGGYDSDAKSVRTPTLLSAAGTIKIGPRFIHKSLATIEPSHADSQPVHSNNDATVSLATQVSPTKSLPKPLPLPETPARMTFSEALQIKPDESPADVLRRVSNAICKGTVALPTTPELRAKYVPDTIDKQAEWRLSLSAPQRTSSLQRQDLNRDCKIEQPDFQVNLKRLADRVKQARRESTTSSLPQSFISELSPALIDFIESVAPADVLDHLDDVSAPVTAVKTNAKQVHEEADTKNAPSTLHTGQQTMIRSETTSGATSSTQSLHLFNMRISQKLASTSRVPMLSSSSSNNTSSKSLATAGRPIMTGQDRSSSIGRVPTFIAIEPIRRPSDPRTKRLFEPPDLDPDSRRRKRSFSNSSIAVPVKPNRERSRSMADSGSNYSCSIVSQSEQHGLDRLPTRQTSLKNANSLAIGGRSASGPAPVGRQSGLAPVKTTVKELESHRDVADQSEVGIRSCKTQAKAANGRSASIPKMSKYIKIDTTPTPVGRRYNPSTEANEGMSEIEMDAILDKRCGNRSSESTQAIDDRRNENFSDNNYDAKILRQDQSTRDGWLTQGRRTGWGFDFANGTPRKREHSLPSDNTVAKTDPSSSLTRRDGAGDVWYKAFQRLGDPVDHGRLLATPQFDREGRRRHSAASVDERSNPDGGRVILPTIHRRSQSVDSAPSRSHHDMEVRKWHRRSLPTLTASNKLSNRKSSHFQDRHVKLKKKSLAELRRRITTERNPTDMSKTPTTWDALGIWGRFASHTRLQRNGPAGSADKVNICDFESAHNSDARPPSKSLGKKTVSSNRRPRNSRNLFTMAKPITSPHNTRGLIANMSPAERASLRRKGLVGKFRRLYRTKSSELYTFVTSQGHRSSISTGFSVKYPELEGLPGEGDHARTPSKLGASESAVDGTSEQMRAPSLDTISEATSKRSRSIQNYTVPWSRKNAEEWSRLYQDCVGSLSALKSDHDLGDNVFDGPATEGRRIFSMTSALRESTVNFQEELARDVDETKDNLLQRLQLSSENVDSPPMPGSFE